MNVYIYALILVYALNAVANVATEHLNSVQFRQRTTKVTVEGSCKKTVRRLTETN